MPYFTYDTSVIVSKRVGILSAMPENFRMSAIVLMELSSAASDRSRQKFYERMFREYHERQRLIIPNAEDWLLAGKILFLLTTNRRKTQGGKLHRLPPGASQRLALDVLIAVSARRWKTQVVTENWNDFKLIQHYCNATIIRAANFFRE